MSQDKIRKEDILKFETLVIEKRNFMTTLCSILEDNGWIKLNSKYTTEGWVYHSTGEKGNSDIYINFFDGYNYSASASYIFSQNSAYFDIRPLIKYTPSETLGAQGVSVPSNAAVQFIMPHIGIGSSVAPDTKYTIRYNCNKDRLIILTTNDVNTVFLMFGRPSNNYAKEYKDTGNMILSSLGYTYSNNRQFPAQTYGIADRPTQAATRINVYYTPSGRNFYKGNLNIAELGFGNATEGIKGFVEGVYYAPNDEDKLANNTMDGDKIVDDFGNEFTILYTGVGASGISVLLPQGYLIVCTKLAGEE